MGRWIWHLNRRGITGRLPSYAMVPGLFQGRSNRSTHRLSIQEASSFSIYHIKGPVESSFTTRMEPSTINNAVSPFQSTPLEHSSRQSSPFNNLSSPLESRCSYSFQFPLSKQPNSHPKASRSSPLSSKSSKTAPSIKDIQRSSHSKSFNENQANSANCSTKYLSFSMKTTPDIGLSIF